MTRGFRPNRRTRLRLVLLAVLSLLFQHCDGMPMTHGRQNSALCPAHCAHQALTTQDAHAPTVPPVSLPALLPAPIVLATSPTTYAAREHTAEWRLSGIPPALRFRVLLI